MAWQKIDPSLARVVKHHAAVTVRVSPPTKRGLSLRLFIAVRPELMEGGLPFWISESTVNFMAGTGDDEGRLRIEPGWDFKIASRGPAGRNAASIIVPAPEWLIATKGDRIECRFDHNDEWLEIDLPAELRRQPEAPPVAAGSKPWSPPFRTAATRAAAPRPAMGGR